VDQAQATADLAASQLSNTRVTSPITGVVSARNVDPGELVSSAVPAFVVIDVSSVTAEMVVEEDRVGSLRVAQTLSVSVEAAGRPSLAGLVESISPASDARTQGYVVKVRVAQPGDAVRPGMFARVRIPTETRTGILVVPNTAVVTETGVDYILQVVDGTVKKTAVQTGISDDTVTEIRAGLTDGAVVITEGQSFLTDGEKVTPAG
jgi:RND family efflux transporter MFP subunit